jgi:hypothetical protein
MQRYNEINEESVLHVVSSSPVAQYEKNESNEKSPIALYLALRQRGVTFSVHSDRLRVDPADRISAKEFEQIRTHKAHLVAFVADPPETWLDRLAQIRTMSPELSALVREEWFDGRAIDLAELTEDEIRALAFDGRRYNVKATPAHLLPGPLPDETVAA